MSATVCYAYHHLTHPSIDGWNKYKVEQTVCGTKSMAVVYIVPRLYHRTIQNNGCTKVTIPLSHKHGPTDDNTNHNSFFRKLYSDSGISPFPAVIGLSKIIYNIIKYFIILTIKQI